ncbi:hypothetical protein ACQRIT_005783 [Beauveria bassiana]
MAPDRSVDQALQTLQSTYVLKTVVDQDPRTIKRLTTLDREKLAFITSQIILTPSCALRDNARPATALNTRATSPRSDSSTSLHLRLGPIDPNKREARLDHARSRQRKQAPPQTTGQPRPLSETRPPKRNLRVIDRPTNFNRPNLTPRRTVLNRPTSPRRQRPRVPTMSAASAGSASGAQPQPAATETMTDPLSSLEARIVQIVSATVSRTYGHLRDASPAPSHTSFASKGLRKNDIGFFKPDQAHLDRDGTGLVTNGGKDIVHVYVYSFTDQLLAHCTSHGEQAARTTHHNIDSYVIRVLRDVRAVNRDPHAQLRQVYDTLDPKIRAIIPAPTSRTTPQSFLQAIREHWTTVRDLAISESNRNLQQNARGPVWQRGQPQPQWTQPNPVWRQSGPAWQQPQWRGQTSRPPYQSRNVQSQPPGKPFPYQAQGSPRPPQTYDVKPPTSGDGQAPPYGGQQRQAPNGTRPPFDGGNGYNRGNNYNGQNRGNGYNGPGRGNGYGGYNRGNGYNGYAGGGLQNRWQSQGNRPYQAAAHHYDHHRDWDDQAVWDQDCDQPDEYWPQGGDYGYEDSSPDMINYGSWTVDHLAEETGVAALEASTEDKTKTADVHFAHVAIMIPDETQVALPAPKDFAFSTQTPDRSAACTVTKTFSLPGVQTDICADTGATLSLVDDGWLATHFPDAVLSSHAKALQIRGIRARSHHATRYVDLPLHFVGTATETDQAVIVRYVTRASVVSDLKANMLLGMDALGPLQCDILLSRGAAVFQRYGVAIPMMPWRLTRSQHFRVTAADTIKADPGETVLVAVSHKATHGSRYLFKPRPRSDATFFTSLADADTVQVLMRNDSRRSVRLSRGTKLSVFRTLPPDTTVHQVNADDAPAAMELAGALDDSPQRFTLRPTDLPDGQTVVHGTGVHIQKGDTEDETAELWKLIDEFKGLFKDKGFAIMPEDELMRVRLKPGWEEAISHKCHVYPQGPDERAVIKRTLQDLIDKGKIDRTRLQVAFAFPVFVVWHGVGDKRKGRMVVDVRALNKQALSDAYPMRRQDDIMADLAHAERITVIDAMSFYYQWLLHQDSTWAFTIVTHAGQFTFRVPIIGYKNYNAYVQRRMDNMLLGTRGLAYCDDVFIASMLTRDHVADLRLVFGRLMAHNVSMGPDKSFIGFQTATVLGRAVNGLSLSTTDDKLAAIKKLKFPRTLKDLKIFLGFTRSLRHNIPRYAIIVEPLQARKTALQRATRARQQAATIIKDAKANPALSAKDLKKCVQDYAPARRAWAARATWDTPTQAETRSFDEIIRALTDHDSLTHFSAHRLLFFDFDASRDGIRVMIYHVLDSALEKIMDNGQVVRYPPSAARQSVAYLSRTLSDAERNYWATKMEVTRYIDIANSTSRHTANKKLIQAMEYISQFDVRVLHRSGKDHVVPDALSRLPTGPPHTHPLAEGQLDDMPDDRPELWLDAPHGQRAPARVYHAGKVAEATLPVHASLVAISPDFKADLIRGYEADPV